MLKNRSLQSELMDDNTLSDPLLAKNLDEIAITNRWFGARWTLLNALNFIYKKFQGEFKQRKIMIADLGVGGGDLLSTMDDWASQKNIDAEFIGIDINTFMIEHAKKHIETIKPTKYITGNILDKKLIESLNFDVSCLNSVTHHFTEDEFIKLLQILQARTRLAIVVNDLRRHILAYYGIKIIGKIFNFCYLTRNDAPLSVLRSFRKDELKRVLAKAGLKSYQIRRFWAFRWQIIIWCKKDITHEN